MCIFIYILVSTEYRGLVIVILIIRITYNASITFPKLECIAEKPTLAVLPLHSRLRVMSQLARFFSHYIITSKSADEYE